MVSPPTILYEAQNLMLRAGTGIATYARNLAQAARRLGYVSDGLFSVERGLSRSGGRLNEVLAFDAVEPDQLSFPWAGLTRPVGDALRAIGSLQALEIPQSGLVISPHGDSLRLFDRIFGARRLLETSSTHFTLYNRLVQLKVDSRPLLFHATHPLPIALKGCANIYTIHDLVPLRLPYTTTDNKRYFYRMLMALAKRADHIVTVSEYSRRDIIEQLGVEEARVTNTYQAIDVAPRFLNQSEDETGRILERQFGLEPGGYFFFYGAIEPKKNIARLVDAYAGSGSRLPLIIADAGGWQNLRDLRRIRDERFVNFRIEGDVVRRQRQVRRLDYLPSDQLMTLIKGARALLFPSIYEGFGLPVVEAMALGTPVVTSNVASLPEVAGDAALLVDPYSSDEIRRAINAIEADADLRRNLSQRGRQQAKKFSLDAYDKRLQALYANLKL